MYSLVNKKQCNKLVLCVVKAQDTSRKEKTAVNEEVRVRINVSGRIFEIYDEHLLKYPTTLLGDTDKRSVYYCKSRNEYFFDRIGEAFEGIFYFYQSNGVFKCPAFIDPEIFYEEIKFYGLFKYLKPERICDDTILTIYNEERRKAEEARLNLEKKWPIFKQPLKSILNRITSFVCLIIVILSIVSICLETMMVEYHIGASNGLNDTIDNDLLIGFRNLLTNEVNSTFSPARFSSILTTERRMEFFIIEFVCNTVFTIETTIRFILTNEKMKFLKSFSNIIDIIAILPFWILLFVNYLPVFVLKTEKHQINQYGLSVLKVLRLTRVLRVLKLSRHIRVLNTMGKILYQCVPEIVLLITFLIVNIIIFSTLMYFIEHQAIAEKSQFISIPHSFWWSIISFTTVGYGDIVPITPYGKLFGSMFILIGILIALLPIPILAAKFEKCYKELSRL